MESSLKAQQALARARECLDEAHLLVAAAKADGAANRAYYAAFQALGGARA